ncbi:MAG: hypothetical protein QOG52_1738 [Frankiaceae bacterium]|jgi:hypothetical protein|nr:hypothetical protein [Frankiaceae bacterium]MDQ1715822.1 hypothetical protein [Frankiaceae bacterium]MDQ1724710.1 hypothetical protein [Frankiaceae bacterium]
MSETDESPHLQEEPQSERGPKGSRDKGGGPGAADGERPAGDPHSDDRTTINQEGTPE